MTLLAGGIILPRYGIYGIQIEMVYYLLQSSERKKKRKENKIHKSESNRTIAVSHVALCPNKRLIWLGGIRVHPAYRRSKVATHLIGKMLLYG